MSTDKQRKALGAAAKVRRPFEGVNKPLRKGMESFKGPGGSLRRKEARPHQLERSLPFARGGPQFSIGRKGGIRSCSQGLEKQR